jgi:hypothetical protein
MKWMGSNSIHNQAAVTTTGLNCSTMGTIGMPLCSNAQLIAVIQSQFRQTLGAHVQ